MILCLFNYSFHLLCSRISRVRGFYSGYFICVTVLFLICMFVKILAPFKLLLIFAVNSAFTSQAASRDEQLFRDK